MEYHCKWHDEGRERREFTDYKWENMLLNIGAMVQLKADYRIKDSTGKLIMVMEER